MSRSEPELVACPECGHKQTVPIWYSVDVTTNPELKYDVLHGRLNVYECNKCGNTCFLDVPLLYHDVLQHLMVWVTDEEGSESPELIPVDMPASELTRLGYRLRIVHSYADLMEKVLIFQDGFDDTTLEVAKAILHARLALNAEPASIQIMYGGFNEAAGDAIQLLVQCSDDDPISALDIPLQVMAHFERMVELWNEETDQTSDGWDCVDIRKAAEVLTWAIEQYGGFPPMEATPD
jgi:hypothetical protein